MPTVGELYQQKWQEAWDRQVPDAKGVSFTDEAHRCLEAAVPGLWDAEVLEGRLSLFDDRGDDVPEEGAPHLRACLVPVPPRVDLAYAAISLVKMLPRFDTWVRVIALKKEG